MYVHTTSSFIAPSEHDALCDGDGVATCLGPGATGLLLETYITWDVAKVINPKIVF